MENNKENLTEKERSIKIIAWAYVQGFKAAARTIDATVDTMDMKDLEDKFLKMFNPTSDENVGDQSLTEE